MFAKLARPLFGEPGADSAKADQTNPDHARIRRPAASAPPWHREALGSISNATLACCAASNVMPRSEQRQIRGTIFHPSKSLQNAHGDAVPHPIAKAAAGLAVRRGRLGNL